MQRISIFRNEQIKKSRFHSFCSYPTCIKRSVLKFVLNIYFPRGRSILTFANILENVRPLKKHGVTQHYLLAERKITTKISLKITLETIVKNRRKISLNILENIIKHKR